MAKAITINSTERKAKEANRAVGFLSGIPLEKLKH
ncbi:MAG: hypothetical protein KatS3mg003_2072 [Candidatus Nitrosocaldaceae archaeon]|nr:MAG: hypothetical protein KatS3mg003_2072 [Candidatus Nitrosocaldaceae archaeon]